MLSDIRSFTTIAEGLDAHELTTFLNHYLTPMTDAILSHQGTVDKYMADGIMAFWNAPLDDPDHCEHACRTALAMRAELARLNIQWRAEASAAGHAFKEVRAGIGLNTGPCVVGNLGSDQRFDYSVLGDDAKGIFNADRYTAYPAMKQVKAKQILLALCWAHQRRDFSSERPAGAELLPWWQTVLLSSAWPR